MRAFQLRRRPHQRRTARSRVADGARVDPSRDRGSKEAATCGKLEFLGRERSLSVGASCGQSAHIDLVQPTAGEGSLHGITDGSRAGQRRSLKAIVARGGSSDKRISRSLRASIVPLSANPAPAGGTIRMVLRPARRTAPFHNVPAVFNCTHEAPTMADADERCVAARQRRNGRTPDADFRVAYGGLRGLRAVGAHSHFVPRHFRQPRGFARTICAAISVRRPTKKGLFASRWIQ